MPTARPPETGSAPPSLRSRPDTRMAALLSIEGVRKEYQVRGKRVLALDSVDLSVAEGEFVTIVGPSGCGKSTLLNLIVGLLRSSSGRIRFRGGVEKSVRRNRAEELIGRVGLSGFEDHYPHELSGGMRQRANIIRTLIYDPELILMDEPFGPLDAQTRIILQDQLLKLWSASRKTIIFITHDLIEAITLADRVVLMTSRPGRIKSIEDVSIPRPRDVFQIHESQQFRSAYEKLWHELRPEVNLAEA